MKTLTNFRGENWLITPAALAANEPPPADIRDQKWLLTLTGVIDADLVGNSTHQWLHETLSFLPSPDPALNYAINRYSIPQPTAGGPSFEIKFSVEEWAPFASLSSIYDQDASDNAGFAVDVWRPTPFLSGPDVLTDQMVSNLFNGIEVDVAVRDTDSWIYRISYHITLLVRSSLLAALSTDATDRSLCEIRYLWSPDPAKCVTNDRHLGGHLRTPQNGSCR